MKFIKIISLMLAIMFFAGSSTYAVPGEGKPEEVEQSSLYSGEVSLIPEEVEQSPFFKIVGAIQEKIDANRELLGASEGKDIIAVLGNTGSGKSTTLNWLAGNSLKVGKLKRIELENPEDPNVLIIGGGGTSVTRFPEAINIGGTEFFDLPGFRDTENGEIELVNVAFIKQILEKANSVKIMFVAGQDLTTADRGTHLKEFLDSLGVMFKGGYNDVLQNSSLFIMTKSDYTNDELSDFLEESVAEEKCPVLYDWVKNGKLFAVCKPQGKAIVEEGKVEILQALKECRGKKLCDLNWSSVYRPETVSLLTGVFEEILKQTFDKMLPNSKKLDSIPSYREAIDNVNGSDTGDFKSFWGRFDKEIDELIVIKLLEPLAEDLLAGTNEKFKVEAQRRLQNFISILEAKMANLQLEFKANLEKSLEVIASSQVKDLNEKVKFDCTDLSEIDGKKKDLKAWSDSVIADRIMTAIKSNEEIKALTRKYEGSNSELYNEFLQSFERNDIKKFVDEVRKSIVTSENECDRFVETMRIKDEAEREKKLREDAEQYQKMLQEQQERFLEEQQKREAERAELHQKEMEAQKAILETQREMYKAEQQRMQDNMKMMMTMMQEKQAEEREQLKAERQRDREFMQMMMETSQRRQEEDRKRFEAERQESAKRIDRLIEQNERLAESQKTTDPCVIC